MEIEQVNVARLSRDLRDAATTLGPAEARFLVDAYYTMQGDRIRADNQLRALSKSCEPHAVLEWLGNQSSVLEKQIGAALDRYSDAQELGRLARTQVGVGPVIAAGLLAHIDIAQAPTVGHIWRFAGLDPTAVWEKGRKRPWNASLKTLCWKLGESFVKVSGNDKATYGQVYKARKVQETERNEAGAFSEQAAARVSTVGKTTDAYKSYSAGKLPPAHIHARAKRYAVKLFLSHYHHAGYELLRGELPPKPYVLTEAGGHAHFIEPNWT